MAYKRYRSKFLGPESEKQFHKRRNFESVGRGHEQTAHRSLGREPQCQNNRPHAAWTGQQCKLATRVTTDDLLPLCASLDNCGFYAVEVWGGVTFDVCMRYLNEDPWDRLRRIKAVMPKTKLQMLLRGQHILASPPSSFTALVAVSMFLKSFVASKMRENVHAIGDGLLSTNFQTILSV